MTKEICAAAIIAIIQIIAMVLVTRWQITSTKALMNPEQNQTQPKTSFLLGMLKYVSRYHLFIIVPALSNIYIVVMTFYEYGITTLTIAFTSLVIIFAIIMSMFYAIITMIEKHNKVLSYVSKRLRCHESIIFELTDKPCNEDGACKFTD